MKRLSLALIGGAAALVLTAPAEAQMNMNMPGMKMPGMKMPAKKKAAPAKKRSPRKKQSANTTKTASKAAPAAKKPASKKGAKTKGAAKKPAAHAMSSMPGMNKQPGHDMSSMQGMSMPAPGQSQSSMPGMTMPQGQSMPSMPGMTMPQSQSMPAMNMGTAPAQGAMTGTNLPAGNAPPPPPPTDHAADYVYPPAAMARAREEFRSEQGGQTFYQVLANLTEYQAKKGRDGYRWDGEAWVGGDINRLWLKSEGEGTFGKGAEAAEVQALYSRAIGPYFNLQAGVRHDFKPTPTRTYATVGVEGMAPFMFATEGALFLSNKGDVLARAEGWYDQRISQRLVLQPRAEANFAAQDIPENGIGSGLSNLELGLRLRYEIRREFAPYVGVSWTRRFGDTARFARAAGEDVSSTSLVVGIRTWF
ncbi:MAG: copper resistance protein B [Pseudomonadota bacterium]